MWSVQYLSYSLTIREWLRQQGKYAEVIVFFSPMFPFKSLLRFFFLILACGQHIQTHHGLGRLLAFSDSQFLHIEEWIWARYLPALNFSDSKTHWLSSHSQVSPGEFVFLPVIPGELSDSRDVNVCLD